MPVGRSGLKPGTVTLLCAVGVSGIGVLLAVLGSWQWTVWLVAGSLLVCSVARLLLSDYAAGWLRVRRKSIDVLATGLMGLSIIMMFLLLPPRS